MDCDDLSEDQERTKIRDELSTMSFEELQKLKEKLGTKVYNEAMFGKTNVQRNRFKRENKNRPREMSSKKPVSAVQQVLPPVKKPPRDPRFDSLCGEFNEKAFKAAYGFISEYKLSELKQLKEELKTVTDPTRKSQIKYLIQRMENQFREVERQKQKQMREDEEKAAQIEALKEGKRPYYRKKAEKRMVELVDQYEELKKKGKVTKKIEKCRKKTVIKNRKNFSESRVE